MKIIVASGKGGTGKTTVAVNLAFITEKDTVLYDFDVEEPNVHLFTKVQHSSKQDVTVMVPQIDLPKCTLCRQCADFCNFNALVQIGDRILVLSELCHACEGCMMVCPTGAIIKTYRPIGHVEKGITDGVPIISGRLNVGEPMSPPMIKDIKDNYFNNNIAISIIDGPPGASCSLVEAVKGADFCLLVTEDTPMGLNDLDIAISVVKKFDIPIGVVINKSDGEYNKVKSYLMKNNIPLLFEIPYDEGIAKLYSEGRILVKESSTYKSMFKKLFDRIMELTNNGKRNNNN